MSPRRRLPSPRFYVWSFIALLIAIRAIASSSSPEQRSFADAPLREGSCQVVDVLAGDTLLVRQEHLPEAVTVRLLSTQAAGIATDGQAIAEEATRFTREFVGAGDVQLRLDNHRLDRHGRYLVYVEVAGEQLNGALLAAGLARFVHFPGNSQAMDRRMSEAQRSAQNNQIGLWATR